MKKAVDQIKIFGSLPYVYRFCSGIENIGSGAAPTACPDPTMKRCNGAPTL